MVVLEDVDPEFICEIVMKACKGEMIVTFEKYKNLKTNRISKIRRFA